MSRMTFVQNRQNKRADLLARNPVFRAMGRRPMSTEKRTDLLIASRVAFAAVDTGKGNDADRDTLACMVNVCMVLAEKHLIGADLEAILDAQRALLRADVRVAEGKRWGFDGEGRAAMLRALDMHDQMAEQFGWAYITDALLTVRERMAAGQAHRIVATQEAA